MNLDSVPVVETVFEMGADDLVFDSLVLVGPILVLVIVFGGRREWVLALVGGYLLVFILNICYNFVWRG